ncbi:hypothetical protein RBSWK_04093 [Rhodopirellula baltica SWK14]|uniref:Uncharacterized protein n=1 Tax=Rhodopirellula baltica SWK14 TaxID=993516 RepID=L7CD58_RHOBT|nr:hypothetical protein RBSWK_04093 [Rhodopirellula baltica SWK14]
MAYCGCPTPPDIDEKQPRCLLSNLSVTPGDFSRSNFRSNCPFRT